MKRKGQQLPNRPDIPGGYGKSKRYKNCCYCETPVPISEVTREHIIPKHKGGRITRPCCLVCNREKGGLDLLDYALLIVNQVKVLLSENDLKNYKQIKKITSKSKELHYLFEVALPRRLRYFIN